MMEKKMRKINQQLCIQNKGAANNYKITENIKSLIGKDEFNSKIWKQLLSSKFSSQDQFQECVTNTFNCGICLSLVTG